MGERTAAAPGVRKRIIYLESRRNFNSRPIERSKARQCIGKKKGKDRERLREKKKKRKEKKPSVGRVTLRSWKEKKFSFIERSMRKMRSLMDDDGCRRWCSS